MKISFRAGKVLGDYIFYSENKCNALMKYNLLDDTVEYLTDFKEDKPDQECLHLKCFGYSGKIWFVPNMSDRISIFDPLTGLMESIKILRYDNSRFCFGDAILLNNILYIVPGNTIQSMIKVNLDTREVQSEGSYNSELNIKASKAQIAWKTCLYDEKIIIPLLNKNKVVLYDIKSNSMSIRQVPVEVLDSAYVYHDKIWLCSGDRKIFYWDIEHDYVTEVTMVSNNSEQCSNVLVAGEECYLVPNYGLEILKYNGSVFVHEPQLILNNKKLLSRDVCFEEYDKWGKNIVFFPSVGGCIVIIDGNNACERKPIIKNRDVMKKKYIMTLKTTMKSDILKEGKFILKDYIEGII